MPPRRRAATTAAADDDVPMREADADLGFDDERDGARAGALGLAAPGAQPVIYGHGPPAHSILGN